MPFRFPIKDVKIEIVSKQKKPKNPLFDDGFFCVNQHECLITIQDIASYFISHGNRIEIALFPGAEKSKIEQLLHSWGTTTILHQQKILNFHASSFELNGSGIMLCGDSGAGKSSLTAAFSANNNSFLTDDLTPVTFNQEKPFLHQLSRQIALKKEALQQMEHIHQPSTGINPFNQKLFFEFSGKQAQTVPLKEVLWINISEGSEPEFSELKGLDKFTMLRGEICGWEMLKGMPETEKAYMTQLIEISKTVRITKVLRPKNFPLMEMKKRIEEYLEKN